jgi:hypothetical protein
MMESQKRSVPRDGDSNRIVLRRNLPLFQKKSEHPEGAAFDCPILKGSPNRFNVITTGKRGKCDMGMAANAQQIPIADRRKGLSYFDKSLLISFVRK